MQWAFVRHIDYVPIIAIIVGIILVYVLHKLIGQSRQGGGIARWVLGGGMIVTLLLASRIFGGRVLYAFLPMIQAWMVGGAKASSGNTAPARSDDMSSKEAALILGVDEGANEQEVKAAYKQLMLKLHPDQGGNDYLASKLNRAKDTLLR